MRMLKAIRKRLSHYSYFAGCPAVKPLNTLKTFPGEHLIDFALGLSAGAQENTVKSHPQLHMSNWSKCSQASAPLAFEGLLTVPLI